MRILKTLLIMFILVYAWHNTGDLNIGISKSNFDALASHHSHKDALVNYCAWDSDESIFEGSASLNINYSDSPEIIDYQSDNIQSIFFSSIWQPPKTS